MEVESAEDALRLFFETFEGQETVENDLFSPRFPFPDGVQVGRWATLDIKLPTYHSEMPSPFIDAYSEIQAAIYRLAAFMEYGVADIRSLTPDDQSRYQLVVKVSEGSSVLDDNVPELINRIAESAFGKMSGRQAVITVLGLGVLFAGAWGFTSHLEGRKEIRLAEIASEERKQALEALTFVTSEHRQQIDRVISIMAAEGESSRRAAATAQDAYTQILRAASRVDETEVGGVHLSQAEARELRGSPRRKSSTEIVEQEMKVVDVNTADPASTTVILEDPETQKQHRVTFSDRVIAAASRDIVIAALAERGTAMFKILRRSVEGDVVSVDIISVTAIDRNQPAVAEGLPAMR